MQPIRFDELRQRYDAILFDAYGVLVSAGGALPGAGETVKRLQADAYPFVIVTNDASRLPEAIATRLAGLGLPVDGAHVISSGSLVAPYFEAHQLHGSATAVLGPEDSREYVRRAGGRIVDAAEPFDVLGVFDEHGPPPLETANDALSTAFNLIDQGVSPTLILPNPDLIAPHGDGRFGFTAGGLALLIENGLALRYPHRDDLTFERLGKPATPMFEEALRRAGSQNAVMIGDQLATDIAGANAAGIDSALISGGVATANVPPDGPQPTWLLPPLDQA